MATIQCPDGHVHDGCPGCSCWCHTAPPVPSPKEDAECCRAAALPDGRPVVGFCSPGCERRPARAGAGA